jgi:hypothetical protein
MGRQADPNAMDTMPDRIRGQIAESEDFLPGRNCYEPRQGRRQGGEAPRKQNEGQRQALICYNCRKIRHFAQDCRQPKHNNYPTNAGPSRNRQSHAEDNDTYVVRQIVDDHTDQQKAQDWLAGVAGQSDEVKDLVMQELWRKEDFQGA